MKISDTDLILNPDGSIYHLNLLPKNISDTVIAVGDPGRVYRVSQFFDEVEFEMNKREFITHVGKYKGKRITVISTGIGPDNVEIFFNELDALVNIDLKTREPKARKRKLKIIRIGTSGALQEDIPVGTHLLSDYAVGLDNLMNFYDLPMDDFETGLAHDIQKKTGLPFMPYVVRGSETLRNQFENEMQVGNTVTCPGFYAPQGRELRLPIRFPQLLEDLNYYHKGEFWLTNFEMETSAYYAFGRLLGHEVLSANAIIANRIKNKFAKDPNKVVESLIKKVLDRI
ncbi:MAG TPA: nucleoside phosphorylase [Cyclobacteriaceae bacterium]|nr:nucleoside phosphorylase [Cytophagales bacterium]HMR57269.1 nucleoside phosphorylase [Cyclobacteriaceae bacterium]HRE66575.1 nucleoside phosphorylase [Cyclobacteriaceae bacterium]HRF31891.1 nucleoside phosphorylase [Cyclobacteriaceae bacterium]